MGYLDFFKAGKKIYIKSPSKAPKGAKIHTGSQGGLYYYSTDDPKSPDYEGVKQPKGKYDKYTEGPWKENVSAKDLEKYKEDQIPKVWRAEDNTQIMREMRELDEFPEDYENWDRREEWEDVYKMLPEYIETNPKDTLEELINKELPYYTGNQKLINIARPLGADPEEYEKQRFVQQHYSEEWKVGDVSIWVPLRNTHYKQNHPDDMHNKLNMVSEALESSFDNSPYPSRFISFTPKESHYQFSWTGRDGRERLTSGWGNCSRPGWDEPWGWKDREKGIEAREGQPETYIQIFNNSSREDKSMWHELGHSIAHQMEEPKFTSETAPAIVDGKEYSQDWADGWLESVSGYNPRDIKLINVKKMKDWNAFMEKWKDKFPEFASRSRRSYDGSPDIGPESPWRDIAHTVQSVGQIKKDGRQRQYNSQTYGYGWLDAGAPALMLDKETVPRLDDDGNQLLGYDRETGESDRPLTNDIYENYSESKFDWIDEMHDDLETMFGKKADIGTEPYWGWDEDDEGNEKDGTWNTGNAWYSFKNLMEDRTQRYEKLPYKNIGDAPGDWLKERQKLGDQVSSELKEGESFALRTTELGFDKPMQAGNFSVDYPATMDNPNGILPKSDIHRAVTWSDQDMKDMQNAKNLIKLQGRYETGFTTAWKYENMRDESGGILPYASQSASESFADSHGFMMKHFSKLKNYEKKGLSAQGEYGKTLKEMWKDEYDWLEKEERRETDAGKPYWDWSTRKEKKKEYRKSWKKKLDAAEKKDKKHEDKFKDHEGSFFLSEFTDWSRGHHHRELTDFSTVNPYKWDWWSRNIMSPELKKYGLPLLSDKESIWDYETKAGKKARERKEKAWALRYEKEHGELPEGWSRD